MLMGCSISSVAGLARQMDLPMRMGGVYPPRPTAIKRRPKRHSVNSITAPLAGVGPAETYFHARGFGGLDAEGLRGGDARCHSTASQIGSAKFQPDRE